MNSNSLRPRFRLVTIVVSCLSTLSCGNQIEREHFIIQTIKVGKGPGSVEIADFNKDGKADIVVANSEDGNVTILLGNGDGRFVEANGSPFSANKFPNDIVIADFNNDGNLDLGIANTEERYLTILLGNGNGQFVPAPKSPFMVNSRPHTHGIAAGDFNGDGILDIATDSWGTNSVLTLSGDGKGNFDKEMSFEVGKRPYQRLRVADVNNDGKPDIITTNLDGNNATVLLGMGEGKFMESKGSPFPAGDAPFGLAIGDINGDHLLDMAIVNSPTITSENKGKDGLFVLLGDGSGKFSAMKGSPFTTGKSPSRVAIGDLNDDGINDIAVTNYNGKSITIFYMTKKSMISSETIVVGNRPDGIAIHSLDGSGRNCIVLSNYDDNNIMILSDRR